jgi:hypothetical protein
MALLALERSRVDYAADFALYGVSVAALSGLLAWAPTHLWPALSLLVLAGLLSWALIENLQHRFVLHGWQPFKRWHAKHHARPTALICAPTLLSALLFFTLVFFPALELGSLWLACALTWGVITGYLVYAITHHAVHHWHGKSQRFLGSRVGNRRRCKEVEPFLLHAACRMSSYAGKECPFLVVTQPKDDHEGFCKKH